MSGERLAVALKFSKTGMLPPYPNSSSEVIPTLVLSNITGTFENNETITDDNSSPGSATVNGTAGGAVTSKGKVALRTLDTTIGLPHGGFPTARRMGGN